MGAIRERPILFSGPMVRAILAGKKTQTRRLVKESLPFAKVDGNAGKTCFTPKRMLSVRGWTAAGEYGESFRRPPCWTGDRLWVQETWQMNEPPSGAIYRADDIAGHIDRGWRPSIFMPRWASRLALEVTGVRVERLQEITEADILSEGVTVDLAAKLTGIPWSDLPTLHHAWAAVWDAINGKRAWASNPWVWVVEFKRSGKS